MRAQATLNEPDQVRWQACVRVCAFMRVRALCLWQPAACCGSHTARPLSGGLHVPTSSFPCHAQHVGHNVDHEWGGSGISGCTTPMGALLNQCLQSSAWLHNIGQLGPRAVLKSMRLSYVENAKEVGTSREQQRKDLDFLDTALPYMQVRMRDAPRARVRAVSSWHQCLQRVCVCVCWHCCLPASSLLHAPTAPPAE